MAKKVYKRKGRVVGEASCVYELPVPQRLTPALQRKRKKNRAKRKAAKRKAGKR